MASPDVLDFAALVAPIPGDNPAGSSLREDFSPKAPYHTLKDLRNSARAAERSMVYSTDQDDGSKSREQQAAEVRAQWRTVAEMVPQLLSERSKDLEITAWLIEALVRLHGYAGLRDGLRLARELAAQFWDGLYPPLEDNDFDSRLYPLSALDAADGSLVPFLLSVPIVGENADQRLSVVDYRRACGLASITDPAKRDKRIADGCPTLELFQQLAGETPGEFYRELSEDLEQAIAEFAQLNQWLEDKCGRDATPPTSNLRNALEGCREAVQAVGKRHLQPTMPAAAAAQSGGELVPSSGGTVLPADSQAGRWVSHVQTREDAFRLLLQVADFFERTEPHSPVSYALKQAVRWGRMPLPELLSELIGEDSARSQLFKLVGIRPPQDSSQT